VLLGLAVVPFLGSLTNGFAWDDVFIIGSNPWVQSGDLWAAVSNTYWPEAFTFAGSGLYRPTTSAALTLQWSLFGGSPVGFHAMSLVLNACVTLVLFRWMRSFTSATAAFVGAALFATHPVHVEAVANVVGQAELLAALFVLLALLAWQHWLDSPSVPVRLATAAGVALLYLAGLGAKEIAVTLPALALLVSWRRGARWSRSLPLLALCAAVLLVYLGLRFDVVGTLRGEVPAPELVGLTTGDRVMTGLSTWVDYVRLLVLPLALSADYGPAVRFPAQGLDPFVVVGGALFLALACTAWMTRKGHPTIALGLGWVLIAILPVSNLLLPAGVILAERTLFLPSVGLALLAAGLAQRGLRERRVLTLSVAIAVVGLWAARSAVRVPVWESSEAVMASLAADHPRSHLMLRAMAVEAMQQGRSAEARTLFDEALALVPNHFSLLSEAAQFEALVSDGERAASFAARAIAVYPQSPHGYVVQARVSQMLGDSAAARESLWVGMRRAEPLTPIWTELEKLRAAPR